MLSISLAMIVRDAASTLERILDAVGNLCEEMIVVDTGSSDRTVEIARRAGAQTHQFAWIDDFAAARNFSFELCNKDWILWLDADDVIEKESNERFMSLKSRCVDDAIDAVFMPYRIAFDSAGNCTMTNYRERLLRRSAGPKWNYAVHECIFVPTERAHFVHDIFVDHKPTAEALAIKDPERNLKILERALSRGERNERNLFYYANELRDHHRLEAATTVYKEFLSCGGRLGERYWAARMLALCYLEMGSPDLALEWSTIATEIDPDRAESFNDIGLIYYEQSRMAEAIPFFTAAAAKRAPLAGLFVEDCHYRWLPHDFLSSCYLAVGDYIKALECGQKALPGHPDQQRVKENIQFLMRLA